MYLLNALKFSQKNLSAHKARTFLTILGIIIGVASVILIMAIGNSAQDLILKQIEGLGSNLVAVTPGASDENGPPASVFGIVVKTLVNKDLESIRKIKSTGWVDSISGYSNGTVLVSRNEKEENLSLVGIESEHIEIIDTKIARGSFFTKTDDNSLNKNVVLGHKVAEKFFKNEDPINKKIKIKKNYFRVIGVFEEEGASAFGVSSQDNSVFIPLQTAQKIILGVDHLNFIRLKVNQSDKVDLVKKELTKIIRKEHGIDNPEKDDFAIKDQAILLKTIKRITDIIRYFLLVVASFSLLVGGIGIMNIMLISVNQRIKEIGLRKSIGAKKRDILIQFLLESIFISLMGGMIGIIIGVFVAFLAFVVINYLGYEWKFLISFMSIFIATSVSLIVGVIFGIYPAQKASKISPMEALRYE